MIKRDVAYVIALVLFVSCGDAQDPATIVEKGAAVKDTGEKCGSYAPLCTNKIAEKIDAYLDSKGKHSGEAHKFSGYILITKDGSPIYSRAMGFADRNRKSPIDSDTNFRIGSVTKQFTAAAILKLKEDGKLMVSDTIETHLPYYPKESASKITIHHLLTHTSGVPSYTDRPGLQELIQKKHSPKELMAISWNDPLDFEPGTKYNYSNSGYAILGAIIEAASGMSYGDYLQKYIFDVAGLTRTVFGDAKGMDNRALGYGVSPKEKIELDDIVDMSVPFSAGGIRSTATDLVLWDHGLKNGSVLSFESTAQLYATEKENYAYGWDVNDVDGHLVISHPGGGAGFYTSYTRYVDDSVVVVVWTNVPNGAFKVCTAINRFLVGDTFEELDHLDSLDDVDSGREKTVSVE